MRVNRTYSLDYDTIRDLNDKISCEICHAMSFVGDEYAQIEHETIQNICILCAVSAEKLGWRIII